jgi:hypothetical protein
VLQRQQQLCPHQLWLCLWLPQHQCERLPLCLLHWQWLALHLWQWLWQQQALLQIYDDFCMQDASDCARCPFPEQVASSSS